MQVFVIDIGAKAPVKTAWAEGGGIEREIGGEPSAGVEEIPSGGGGWGGDQVELDFAGSVERGDAACRGEEIRRGAIDIEFDEARAGEVDIPGDGAVAGGAIGEAERGAVAGIQACAACRESTLAAKEERACSGLDLAGVGVCAIEGGGECGRLHDIASAADVV